MEDFFDPIYCPKCRQSIEDLHSFHLNNAGMNCHTGLKQAFVYLLQNQDMNLLKIGFTGNLDRRVREIKNANTNTIVLLAAFQGTKVNEKILHSRWKRMKFKGEWFNYVLEIEDYFENHPRKVELL